MNISASLDEIDSLARVYAKGNILYFAAHLIAASTFCQEFSRRLNPEKFLSNRSRISNNGFGIDSFFSFLRNVNLTLNCIINP